jgi:type III restriction enzyme
LKLELKDFQEEAVEDLVGKVRYAMEGAAKIGPQAVVLAAPTGSGKTVIATATIERILDGDDSAEPESDATFLWITDLPELNEQTRDKMESTSNILNLFNLEVIESSFDKRVFDPGKVYFLNTQKLGRDKLLTQKGDGRTYSIWETIQNTIHEPGSHFYLIIDEAHRGMRSKKDDEAAATIIQKFLKGSDEIDPVPMVIGISATPARFDALIKGQGRTTARTEVPIEAVRDSGLLKDKIVLHNPEDDQRADMTLLGEAAKHWQGITARWLAYCEAEMTEPVVPILVVQVENAPKGKTGTKTPVDTAITTINSVLPKPLPAEAFAHSFDESADLEVKGKTVRYLAPSKIATDRQVRVVFFKTALSTGWDCPQAETMMSFRKASDATFIAQLIGRMVRTPLARRIHSDEVLNSVALYLPHYDQKGVESVVAKLQDPDYEYVPPVEVTLSSETVTLSRRFGTESHFAALAKIPSYVVPTQRKTKQTGRLMKMARALVKDDLDAGALATAEKAVISELDTLLTDAEKDPAFGAAVAGKSLIAYGQRVFDVRTGELAVGEKVEVAADPTNVQHLFDDSGRKVGEGLHKVYWQHRTAGVEDLDEIRSEKIKVAVLITRPDTVKKLEALAEKQVDVWHKDHVDAIEGLAEDRRDVYLQILGGATSPVEVSLDLQETVLWRKPKESQPYDGHLYVDPAGSFEENFTSSWETELLEEELANPDVVGWLRNRPRQQGSLQVPFQQKGRYLPMYPDFLMVREVGGKYVVDILDPHDPSRDGVAKAQGLAKFAQDHGVKFGRIQILAEVEGVLRRLELTDPKVREAISVAGSADALVLLYKTMGK